jgi:hypothetical protein
MAKVTQTLELRTKLRNQQNAARLNAIFAAVIFGLPSPSDYEEVDDTTFVNR